MRLKKLLSVVTAVAMALSAVVVAPPNNTIVQAAEKTEVLWTGEKTTTWGSLFSAGTYLSGYSTATLTIEATTGNIMIYAGDWGTRLWQENVNGTQEIELSSEDLVAIQASGLYIGGNESVVTSISVTGDYEEVIPDVWVEVDGRYSCTNGQETQANSDELLIPAPSSSDGLILFSANFAIGGGQLTYTKADGNTQSVVVPSGGVQTFIFDSVKADSNIVYQKWWMNPGATETVSNITMTEVVAEAKYIQKTSVDWDNGGTYSQRFVVLVPEEELQGKSSVSFNISNGNGTATFSSTKYYSTVSVTGNPITAPDGYYFISYAISDIPYDKTLTFVDYSIN